MSILNAQFDAFYAEAHVEGAAQGAAGFSGIFLLSSIISFR